MALRKVLRTPGTSTSGEVSSVMKITGPAKKRKMMKIVSSVEMKVEIYSSNLPY